MAEADIVSDEEIAALLRRADEANGALLGGDAGRYLAMVAPAEDFTLMSPFGGPPTTRLDRSPEAVAALGRFFRGGAGRLELVRAYAVPGMVVLALIERQRAAVGGLPEQDWPLRVTLVFRRDAGGAWRLAHRHADPLVPGITLAQAAALARGDAGPAAP